MDVDEKGLTSALGRVFSAARTELWSNDRVLGVPQRSLRTWTGRDGAAALLGLGVVSSALVLLSYVGRRTNALMAKEAKAARRRRRAAKEQARKDAEDVKWAAPKVQLRFRLSAADVRTLDEAVMLYDIVDEHKAARIVLQYAMQDGPWGEILVAPAGSAIDAQAVVEADRAVEMGGLCEDEMDEDETAEDEESVFAVVTLSLYADQRDWLQGARGSTHHVSVSCLMRRLLQHARTASEEVREDIFCTVRCHHCIS